MKNQYFLLVLLLTVALILPGCASRPSNCASPEVFCVGLVTAVGLRDDHAYNQAAWDGVKQAASAKVADWTASIESVDARDYDANIAVFADAGYDVIVTVGSGLDDATRSAAGKYPGTYFIGVDQSEPTDQAPSPNLAGVVFPADQAGFLAGAAAALMTRTG
jgi:basic membrane protein A